MPGNRYATGSPSHQQPYPGQLHAHLGAAIDAHLELAAEPDGQLAASMPAPTPIELTPAPTIGGLSDLRTVLETERGDDAVTD